MNRTLVITILSLAITAPALAAGHHPLRQESRPHFADRLERQGDRINARLDRQADRVERHFERRAEHAEGHGNAVLADRLRDRGERIAGHLDRKGDRIEARFDRRAERFKMRNDLRTVRIDRHHPHFDRLAWYYGVPRYGFRCR